MSDRPPALEEPWLVDTAVWTWSRDRRFPHLKPWFDAQVVAGNVLVCDVVILELVRLAANERRADEIAGRLTGFASVPMPDDVWRRCRELQLALSPAGHHRRVPPTDLLIAAAAQDAGVPLLHYDADYDLIAGVSDLRHRWFVPRGTLSP
ncbi:MAG: PIN domain-containing protein [Solirubrobacterales bacterium]|jgi:predicted nucleic acid-binding protein|nr:PIN domain-containing protein [Solirubrobacterales bacterium]